jgi:hypothetical protein
MKLLPSFLSRRTSAVTAAAFVVAALIAIPASPASAVSCSGMVNPVNATNIKTARSMGLSSGEQLELRYGTINGVQYAWTRLVGDTGGDKIWIDISGDSGNNHVQCDLRTLTADGRNYGQALKTSSSASVVMRAGARPSGLFNGSSVTTWW